MPTSTSLKFTCDVADLVAGKIQNYPEESVIVPEGEILLLPWIRIFLSQSLAQFEIGVFSIQVSCHEEEKNSEGRMICVDIEDARFIDHLEIDFVGARFERFSLQARPTDADQQRLYFNEMLNSTLMQNSKIKIVKTNREDEETEYKFVLTSDCISGSRVCSHPLTPHQIEALFY